MDYVCATGKANTVRELCRVAFDAAGIDNWEKYVVSSQKYIRPAELDYLRGDSSKLQQELEWKPRVNFEQLITMMVAEDIRRQND